MRPALGSLIGAVGGLVFVLVNAGGLPPRESLRPYLVAVGAMAVAIPLGSVALRRLVDRPELTLPWVVLVVGLHFLPMAAAFGGPVFRTLGLGLALVALLGGALTLLAGPVWASATGVAAGFALLA